MTENLGDVFLTALLATPEGRQQMLSVSVDAEEGDESGVFDQLADCVDDPDLKRIVVRHRDDEVRHAALFRGCLDRLGMEKVTLGDGMRLIRELGDGGERAIETAEDIVATYALLFAIEERGVERFPRIAEAFRPHDPETAEVYLQVARDERGHIRYCERIGRHYAPSDSAWDDAVTHARQLEAAAFERVGIATLNAAVEQGLVDLDALLTAGPA